MEVPIIYFITMIVKIFINDEYMGGYYLSLHNTMFKFGKKYSDCLRIFSSANYEKSYFRDYINSRITLFLAKIQLLFHDKINVDLLCDIPGVSHIVLKLLIDKKAATRLKSDKST